jgi:truncated hemoglobin YjbI
MALVTEIAPDVYRISVYAPAIDMQFNHFLVRDEAPLLFHAGYKGMFGEVRQAVETLIDPGRLRYVGFSHFESDECGALNEWLELAPSAETVSGVVGSLVNLNDFAIRPARACTAEDVLETGRYRFRFVPTPHVPHGWDAGVLFEETRRTLFCSDLFHQWGEVEPLTQSSILERSREALLKVQASPLAGYVPYTHHTGRILAELAALKPRTLAVMHGSSFQGDGESALHGLAEIMKTCLGPSYGTKKPQGTLYQRLGGYDTIAGIIDDLFARLREDARFTRFAAGRSLDSHHRARQLLVDQLCALAGGPCYYIGRDMKTSHAGLAINEAEWTANLDHTRAALSRYGIPEAEQAEFLSLFTRYRDEIVEPAASAAGSSSTGQG